MDTVSHRGWACRWSACGRTVIEQNPTGLCGRREVPHGARVPFWRADSRDGLLGHPHRHADTSSRRREPDAPVAAQHAAASPQKPPTAREPRCTQDRAAAACNVRPRRATNRRTGRAAVWSATRDADGGPSGIACNAVGSESVWLNARETCATRAARGSPRRPIGAVSSVKIERPTASAKAAREVRGLGHCPWRGQSSRTPAGILEVRRSTLELDVPPRPCCGT